MKFDRQDTKAIKGIAVIMMLFCHLAVLTQRYPYGFDGFSSIIPGFVEGGYLEKFASECRFCVAIFFFLGGYGLYMRMQKAGFSIGQTIINLYLSYWKVFVIFIPIGFLFFSRSGDNINPMSTRFSSYGMLELATLLLSEFVGITCKINGEWWFFIEYVCILPMGYLFIKAIRRSKDFWVDFILVLVIDLLIRDIVPQIPSLTLFSTASDNILYSFFLNFNSLSTPFFAGIVMAKYDGVCYVKRLLSRLPCKVTICAGGILAAFLLRMYVMGPDVDIIICAFLIPMFSVILDVLRPLKVVFCYLGKHSTNIWLTHSFFCYYFLEFTYLVYSTSSVMIDLLILLGLSLVSSMLLDAFYKVMWKFHKRVHASKNNKTA